MENEDYSFDVDIKAKELIDIIKTRFITSEGLLARNYPAGSRTLFDNFDDLVPFFIFFDETDFLLSQVRIIRKMDLNIMALCAENDVLVTRNVDEWFGGLYALWQETGDEISYNLLKESVEFVLNNLIKDVFLSAAYFNDGSIAPYFESWSSGLLETFCEMRQEFPSAFEQAQGILKSWVESDYFQSYSIFPYRVYLSPTMMFFQRRLLSRFPPLMRYSKPLPLFKEGIKREVKNIIKHMLFYGSNGLYSQLMKSNSTCAFALLEFYKATGNKVWIDALLDWINNALKYFCSNGKVYMEVIPKTGRRRAPGITPAFILIDVLCDTIFFVADLTSGKKEEYLIRIKHIIDYSWGNRLENRLIPFNDDGDFAHIDDQIDFAISLRRYFDLTGDEEYKEKSIFLTRRVIELHYSPEGYYTYSGKIKDNIIDPKYNALLLKGFANLATINEPLYPKYYSLFKDR